MVLDDCNLPQEIKLSIVRLALNQMNHEEGGDKELLAKLNALQLADLEIFCRRMPIKIDIDVQAFRDSLERLRHARKAENLVREFVRRGASNQMLHKLFGISKAQAEIIRGREGLARKFIGRPKLPAQKTREKVFAKWGELSAQTPDQRERYLRLSEAFPEMTICSLHQVVCHGEKAASFTCKLKEVLQG